MIDLVLYIYTQYSNLSTDEMNSTIEEVKTILSLAALMHDLNII